MKWERILIFILTGIIILLLFGGFFFFYEAQFMSGKASVVNTSFSAENSYVMPVPAQAKADGEQQIRVNVFILNGQGLGVMGKKVQVSNPDPSNIVIDPVQPTTDSLGKAYFDISARSSGLYYAEVQAEGLKLPQKVSLNFK